MLHGPSMQFVVRSCSGASDDSTRAPSHLNTSSRFLYSRESKAQQILICQSNLPTSFGIMIRFNSILSFSLLTICSAISTEQQPVGAGEGAKLNPEDDLIKK